jgi:hypothetical protein
MKKNHVVCNIRTINFLVSLLLLAGINSGLRAQSINIDLDVPIIPIVTVPIKTVGGAIGVGPITTSSSNPPVTLTIASVEDIDKLGFPVGGVGCGGFNPACPAELTPIVISGAITITDNGSNISFSGNIPAALDGHTIRIVVQAADMVHPYQVTVNIPMRKAIDLALVLDKSGSMGWSFDGTNFSPPAGQSRYDGLKSGINVMADNLSTLTLLATDKIAIRYFESTPSPVFIPPLPSVFSGGLVTMNGTNLTNAKTEVGLRGPGSGTALGDGILAGKGLLLPGTAGNRKVMIVFSDGMQNEGDQVKTVAPNAYQQTVLGTDLNGANELTIHTICLGTSSTNPILMNEIAINNGSGHYFNSMVGDNNEFLTTSFLGNMQNILNGSSPQYVGFRSGRFSIDPATSRMTAKETFIVNKFVNNVFVVLAAENRNEPVFSSVLKDGVELNQYIQRTSGQGYRTFSIKFPIPSLPNMKPDGEWKITALLGSSPAVGPSYTLSFTVDDHLTKINYSLGNKIFKVGEILKPTVSIARNAAAVTTASVQAIILKPGDDINDLLARSNVKFDPTPGDPSTPDVGKLSELLKDSAFLAKMKALNRVVTLTFDAAAKNYTGSFSELDVVGVYRCMYMISDNDTLFGSLNRFDQESFNVRFKDIDLAHSNLRLSVDSLTGASIITFRPISSTGKFIGPGWGSVISINAPGLKIKQVQDLGDGTYKIFFDGKLAGNGKLSLADETFYDGNLADVGKGGKGGKGGSGVDINKLIHEWWFWALLLLLLIIIIIMLRKKKKP